MPGYFLATLQAAIELIGKLDKKTLVANLGPSSFAPTTSSSSSASSTVTKDSKATDPATHSRHNSGGAASNTVTSTPKPGHQRSRTGSDASAPSPTGSMGSRSSINSQLSQILRDFT